MNSDAEALLSHGKGARVSLLSQRQAQEDANNVTAEAQRLQQLADAKDPLRASGIQRTQEEHEWHAAAATSRPGVVGEKAWFQMAVDTARHALDTAREAAEEVFEEALGTEKNTAQRGADDIATWRGQATARQGIELSAEDRRTAEGGSPDDLFRLAEGYYYGETVAQSYEQAVKYYHQASDRGCIEATTKLGLCAKKGHGMELDLKESLKFFNEAAQSGDLSAMHHCGLCHYNGEGTPVDFGRAAELFHAAAEEGYLRSMQSLGEMYDRGQGVGRDPPMALELWLAAAAQGLPAAQVLRPSPNPNALKRDT